jgi:restriction endonuclease Mrr
VHQGRSDPADAGTAIGKSGDGGIDGIIKEDKLGLDVVYIQAKRLGNNPVGRPDVMQFAGAWRAQKANKGIFITTSRAPRMPAAAFLKSVVSDGSQNMQYSYIDLRTNCGTIQII